MTEPTDAGRPRPSRPRGRVISITVLPSLPPPLAGLLRLANNPSVTPRDLREAVENAPEFAARVLRALSATHPRPRSIDDALRAVGTRRMRGVVSALALAPLFDDGAARSVVPARMAAHGLACALWSAEVAQALGHQPSTNLITAALMHDVGMLLLDRFVPDDFAAVLERARREGLHHVEVEQVDLAQTHARAGALLCARWSLPPQVTELVAAHHAPDAGGTADGRLLAVADHLAARHGHASLDGSPPRPLAPDTLVALGVDAVTLDALGGLAPLVEAQLRTILAAAAS